MHISYLFKNDSIVADTYYSQEDFISCFIGVVKQNLSPVIASKRGNRHKLLRLLAILYAVFYNLR